MVLGAGCGGSGGISAGRADAGGTIVVALAADVRNLLPAYAISTQDQMVADLMFDRLADPGDSLNTVGDRGFLPRLAERWSWSADSLSITFHLDPRARWHDGVPVRATDVRFTYRLFTDTTAAVPAASQLAAIDSVTTPDSLTATFWFKHRYPEQFFDATYQMHICPEHLLRGIPTSALLASAFSKHPVGDGQFRFASWTPGSALELVADTMNYRGRPKLDRVILSISPNYGAAMAKLLAGDADLFESVHPDNLSEVRRRPDLTTIPYDDPSYGFLWFNLRTAKGTRPHPLFADRDLRRALSMAIDRAAIVRNVFDTLAYVPPGPFPRGASNADPSAPALPYDTMRADRLLDSAGWRRGSDGIRRKGARELAFTLSVPTSSKTRQQIAVLIQDQLAHVGARVTVDPMEMPVLMQRLEGHDFDAVLQNWRTDGAMDDLRQTWTTDAVRHGANYGDYANPTFDALVDSALTTSDPARVHELLHRAYTILDNDAPAVWLYQPRLVAGVHRRLHHAPFRPDAWWAHLADWSVPVADRLPRDNIGLTARTTAQAQ